MKYRNIIVVFVITFVTMSSCATVLTEEEPQCISRFDYDFRMLKKLVTLEQRYEELQEVTKQQQDLLQSMRINYEGDLDQLKSDTSRLLSAMSREGSGSTYVHWGRNSCPLNGTEIVYTGFAGGSYHAHPGAASNYLCLPSDPLWGDFDDSVNDLAIVYGSEYEINSAHAQKLFGSTLQEGDVPCAVCSSVRSRIVMIPARNACYDGWTLEYSGYLTGGYHNHPAASEFVCLDRRPETLPGGHGNHDGKLFYLAEAKCGSLKCPPYVNGRELTCVVCTK